MAMVQVNHECSTDTEKLYASYKWTLNDWVLLHDLHYSKKVTSLEFPIAGTKGSTCRLSLSPSTSRYGKRCACVEVEFSDDLDFIMIESSICFANDEMKLLYPKCSSQHKKPDAENIIKIYDDIDLTKGTCKKSLKTDILILIVELTIVKSVSTTPFFDKAPIENFPTSFFQNLGRLQDSKSLCDVTFVIGDQKLFAHKLILAAHSEVFGAMFASGMQEERESTVHIIDIDATVFGEFLNYMYSGKVNNLDSIVDKLIIVADKYQVHDLKVWCENVIALRINTGNVIEILITADKLCLTNLKKKAIAFVKANICVLKDTAEYKMLFDYPTLIGEVFSA